MVQLTPTSPGGWHLIKHALCISLIVLGAQSSSAQPLAPGVLVSLPASEAAVRACRDLDRVQIADPEPGANYNYYYVCCEGEPIRFPCLVPSKRVTTVEYSDAADARYNPLAGECERMPESRLSALYRSVEVANRTLRSNGNPFANFRALPKNDAAAVCDAKARNEAPQRLEQRVKAEMLPQYPSDVPRKPFPIGRRGINGTTVTSFDGRVRGASSPFRQATGEGWYEIIRAPDGRSSTGTTAVHMAAIAGTDQVLVWGRVNSDGSNEYEPGMLDGNGQPLWATRYDPFQGTYQPLEMPGGASFCSGHTILSDGTVVAAGGDAGIGSQTNGLYSIRVYRLNTGAWEDTPAKMPNPHWYPAQLTLPDDRVIIMGGSASESGPWEVSASIYTPGTNDLRNIDTVPFLQVMDGVNHYPGLYLLPWTNNPDLYYMMAFSCDYGEILTIDRNSDINTFSTLPGWPGPAGYCSMMSSQGSGVLLPLRPGNGYAAEHAMFGGTTKWGNGCECDTPAHNKAYRIRLDQETVLGGTQAWEVEDMPAGRNMANALVLPNGQVLLVNGAYRGRAGTADARDPVLNAWMYSPDAPRGQRFRTLAASTIPRYYHGNAMLLSDGSVLVAGSDQAECVSTCYQRNLLRQVQAERFLPPYFFSPFQERRPTIAIEGTGGVRGAAFGETIAVTFTGTATAAVLIAPAAVTHQADQHSRVIEVSVRAAGDNGQVLQVTMPPGPLVAPPGYYMMFLLNEDVPCTKAQWVRLG